LGDGLAFATDAGADGACTDDADGACFGDGAGAAAFPADFVAGAFFAAGLAADLAAGFAVDAFVAGFAAGFVTGFVADTFAAGFPADDFTTGFAADVLAADLTASARARIPFFISLFFPAIITPPIKYYSIRISLANQGVGQLPHYNKNHPCVKLSKS